MPHKPTRESMHDEVLKTMAARGLFSLPSDDGDPRALAEQMLKDIAGQTRQQMLDGLLVDIARGMLPTIAQSLPTLGEPGAIGVRQVLHWRIDAGVTKSPPYQAVVSSNLVFFLHQMIQALHSGLGIRLVDAEDQPDGEPMPPREVREVARDVKHLLDSFIAEQQVPTQPIDAPAGRYMLQFRLFHCALSWVLGHELGHVVVSESRRRRQGAPFEETAAGLLDQHFDQLLGDRRFKPQLGELNEKQKLAVYDAWLSELNADLIGASLACGYQKDHGPSRRVPEVVGFTKFALHLGLMAQYLLEAYQHTHDTSHALATRTHPPIDFRMHVVLCWMYRDRVKEATATPTAYVQQVFEEVFRQGGHTVGLS